MPLIIFVVYIVVIAYESLTKGWLSFVLFPYLAVIIPISNAMYIITRRQQASRPDRLLQLSYYLTIGSVFLGYVTVPGIGDTEDVFLFGFLTANVNDLITTISTWIADACCVIVLIGFIIWLICSVRHRRQRNVTIT